MNPLKDLILDLQVMEVTTGFSCKNLITTILILYGAK